MMRNWSKLLEGEVIRSKLEVGKCYRMLDLTNGEYSIIRIWAIEDTLPVPYNNIHFRRMNGLIEDSRDEHMHVLTPRDTDRAYIFYKLPDLEAVLYENLGD